MYTEHIFHAVLCCLLLLTLNFLFWHSNERIQIGHFLNKLHHSKLLLLIKFKRWVRKVKSYHWNVTGRQAERNEMRLSTIEFVDVGKGRARGVGNFLVIFYFFLSVISACMPFLKKSSSSPFLIIAMFLASSVRHCIFQHHQHKLLLLASLVFFFKIRLCALRVALHGYNKKRVAVRRQWCLL